MEAIAVIWSPISALARVAEERRVLLGFGTVALYAALGLVNAILAVLGGLAQSQFEVGGAESPPGLEDLLVYVEVFSVISAVVWPFVLWLLVSGLMHLITRFFGGTGPFSGMLAAVGVAQVPFVIETVIGFVITGLQILLLPEGLTSEVFDAPSPTGTAIGVGTAIGSLSLLLGLAFLLWHAALVVIGAAFARRVGYGESAGSCAISCAGCVGLILTVVMVFAVLIALLVGAADLNGPS